MVPRLSSLPRAHRRRPQSRYLPVLSNRPLLRLRSSPGLRQVHRPRRWCRPSRPARNHPLARSNPSVLPVRQRRQRVSGPRSRHSKARHGQRRPRVLHRVLLRKRPLAPAPLFRPAANLFPRPRVHRCHAVANRSRRLLVGEDADLRRHLRVVRAVLLAEGLPEDHVPRVAPEVASVVPEVVASLRPPQVHPVVLQVLAVLVVDVPVGRRNVHVARVVGVAVAKSSSPWTCPLTRLPQRRCQWVS